MSSLLAVAAEVGDALAGGDLGDAGAAGGAGLAALAVDLEEVAALLIVEFVAHLLESKDSWVLEADDAEEPSRVSLPALGPYAAPA